MAVQDLEELLIAFDGFVMALVLGDKVHLEDAVFSTVNTVDQRLYPDSHACELGMRERHWRSLVFVRKVVKDVFNLFNFGFKHVVDFGSCLVVDEVDYVSAFG